MDWTRVLEALLLFLGGAGGERLARAWRERKDRPRTDLDRMAAERDRAAADRDRIAAERDHEAAHRRRLEESLSAHRRIIIEAPCLTNDDLPTYPD